MTSHNPTIKIFCSVGEAREEMERMGVHSRGIELMLPKALFKVIKLEKVSSAAAHIIKQEMLAADGEAATSRDTIDGSASHTDILLMGTEKVFDRLLYKLRGQPYGLPAIGEEVGDVMESSRKESYTLSTARREMVIGPGIMVMGIVNTTPDSFYGGSRCHSVDDAVEKALKMVEEGADIIDVGGESTRPGSGPVDEKDELGRVLPVIRSLASRVEVPISVDTRKASVADASVREGAEIVNDVSGLSFDPCMAGAVAESGAALVINHSRGLPENMRELAHYSSLLSDVMAELRSSMERAFDSGIGEDSVIIDPGLGFAKEAGHNFKILKHLREFLSPGRPLMVGPSRKSFLGHDGKAPPEERLEESLAASVVAAVNGARIIRTHDVAATKKALWVVDQMNHPGC